MSSFLCCLYEIYFSSCCQIITQTFVHISRFSIALLICRDVQQNVFSIFWANFIYLLQLPITSSGLNADRALCSGCTVSGKYCTSLYMNYGIGACRKCIGLMNSCSRGEINLIIETQGYCGKLAKHFINTYIACYPLPK